MPPAVSKCTDVQTNLGDGPLTDIEYTTEAAEIERLELLLSSPSDELVSMMGRLRGDILILGAGGKIGPSISRMAKRASDQAGTPRRIIAASRFSRLEAKSRLEASGVETIAIDLLDAQQLESLPDVKNVIYLAGFKFGSWGQPSLTWAVNSYVPGLVMDRFRNSRIVAFSTGCVYGLSKVAMAGAIESDRLQPSDEYSMSCLGRERIIEHFSRENKTQAALLRLNYAVELRYGVLVDIAKMVYTGQTIDLTMGHVNVIWQGDANAMAICALEKTSSPPLVLNLVGPELLSIRRVAELFGEIFNKPVHFDGTESSTCFLSNGQLCHQMFGYPHVPVRRIIEWTAEWITESRTTNNQPTCFQERNGNFKGSP